MRLVRTRRGNAQITVISLFVLLGFGALSVDIGQVVLAHTQAQVVADAAVLGGSAYLDGTVAGLNLAITKAEHFGELNKILGVDGDVDTSSITFGTISNGAFVPVVGDLNSDETAATINAMRIDHEVTAITGALSGVAFNVSELTTQAQSTAIRPAGAASSVDCYLPLAIPDCVYIDWDDPDNNPPPFEFNFGSSQNDDVAWADPDENPNTDQLRLQLNGKCNQGEIGLGDELYVNEGQHTAATQEILGILNEENLLTAPTLWDDETLGGMPARNGTTANLASDSDVDNINWGNVIEGPVALVDAGADCANVSFTGTKPITGFTWAIIFDGRDSSNPKNIWIQADFINEHLTTGDTDPDALGNTLVDGDPILSL